MHQDKNTNMQLIENKQMDNMYTPQVNQPNMNQNIELRGLVQNQI